MSTSKKSLLNKENQCIVELYENIQNHNELSAVVKFITEKNNLSYYEKDILKAHIQSICTSTTLSDEEKSNTLSVIAEEIKQNIFTIEGIGDILKGNNQSQDEKSVQSFLTAMNNIADKLRDVRLIMDNVNLFNTFIKLRGDVQRKVQNNTLTGKHYESSQITKWMGEMESIMKVLRVDSSVPVQMYLELKALRGGQVPDTSHEAEVVAPTNNRVQSQSGRIIDMEGPQALGNGSQPRLGNGGQPRLGNGSQPRLGNGGMGY